MSGFRVGDLVEIVSVDDPAWASNIGFQGVVTFVAIDVIEGEVIRFDDGEFARARNCRLVRPPSKDDSTPRDEFIPADPAAWDLAMWSPNKTKEQTT